MRLKTYALASVSHSVLGYLIVCIGRQTFGFVGGELWGIPAKV